MPSPESNAPTLAESARPVMSRRSFLDAGRSALALAGISLLGGSTAPAVTIRNFTERLEAATDMRFAEPTPEEAYYAPWQ